MFSKLIQLESQSDSINTRQFVCPCVFGIKVFSHLKIFGKGLNIVVIEKFHFSENLPYFKIFRKLY